MTLRLVLFTLFLFAPIPQNRFPLFSAWSPTQIHAQTTEDRDAQLKKLVEEYLATRTVEDNSQKREKERKQLISDIILNVAKGIAIVIALLVLRAIIGAIGRGVAAEDVSSIICVFVTTPTEEEAEKIAGELMDENLVQSAKITPRIRSIYRWQDKVEDESETLTIFKTKLMHVPEIIDKVAVVHSYDVPEIIALPALLTPYLDMDEDFGRPWWKQLLGRA